MKSYAERTMTSMAGWSGDDGGDPIRMKQKLELIISRHFFVYMMYIVVCIWEKLRLYTEKYL